MVKSIKFLPKFAYKIIYGSLSNAGVRLQSHEGSDSEGMEAAQTKSDAFEGLNWVVAAFCEPVGQWYIKSVEHVGVLIFQHPAAILELREFDAVAGVEECLQAIFGSFSVLSIHEE